MFQDFSGRSVAGGPGAAATAGRTDQPADLISRYPNLSEIELAQLINSYRRLPGLEVALMISDDELGPKLDRFCNDHRSRLRTPFRQYAILVAIAVVGIATTLWAVVFAI